MPVHASRLLHRASPHARRSLESPSLAEPLILARRRRRALFLLRPSQRVGRVESREVLREIARAVVGLAAVGAWGGVFLLVAG